MSEESPYPCRLRIGLVGYGFGGRFFHAPLIRAACELVGVVTRSPERRAQVAADSPEVRVFDDLDALAAAGAEAVAISTPVHTHLTLVHRSIELGLAVVCDKPFATDAASAEQAVDFAASRNVPLTVYHNARWDSDFLTARRLLAAGALGEIRRLESHLEWFHPPGPPLAGGGALLDLGSHLIDQAMSLFGAVDRVYAERLVRADDGREDDVFVALTHTSGVVSHLHAGWAQHLPAARFRITGTSATYVVDGKDGQQDLVLSGRTPATEGEKWGCEPPERQSELHRGGAQSERVPLERGRWDAFYPLFAAAVRGAGPVPVDPSDAVRTARVLDAARESARAGRVVTLR